MLKAPLALLVLVLLLAMPGAASMSAGELQWTGPLQLPPGSRYESAAPLALWIADTSEATVWISSPRVVVERYWSNPVVAASPLGPSLYFAPQLHSASYELHNVSVRASAAGDHRGWMGAYPGGDARASVLGETIVRPSGASIVGNSPAIESEPEPDRWIYARAFDRPHLVAEGSGGIVLEGSGGLKIMGWDLVLEADENRSEIATSPAETSTGGAPLAYGAHSWVYLRYEEASVHVAGARLQLVSGPALADWHGRMIAADGRGRVGAEQVEGGAVVVDGDLRADVGARAVGSRTVGELALSGEIYAQAWRRAEPESAWDLPLVVGVAVAVGGLGLGGVLAARKSPPRQEGLTITDFRRRLRAGRAEIAYASMLLGYRGDADEAERWAVEGLRLDPERVAEILFEDEGVPGGVSESPLRQLLGRPAFDAAVARARAQAGLYVEVLGREDAETKK